MLNHFGELFLKKQNTSLLYDPTIPPLGTYLREMSVYVPRNTCRRMLRSASFIIAQNWEQFKYSLTGKWCIHIMEY